MKLGSRHKTNPAPTKAGNNGWFEKFVGALAVGTGFLESISS